MCLFKRSKCLTAEEDLITYKVLYKNMTSLYYRFPYQLNKTYFKKWTFDFLSYVSTKREIGGNCFHSCLDKQECERLYLEDKSKQFITKCIIPKGSRYFLGTFSEVASEQIILQEICH